MYYTMKSTLQACLSLVILTYLCGCTHSKWISDQDIDASKRTPQELIGYLGAPARAVKKQTRVFPAKGASWFEGEVTVYEYWFRDLAGAIQYRRYYYSNENYLNESMSTDVLSGWRHRKLRVISEHGALDEADTDD